MPPTADPRPLTRPGGPLGALSFSLVGPGRVGTSLAAWLTSSGARLNQVAGHEGNAGEPAFGALELAARLGGQAVRLDEMETSRDDLLLVAVSDGALPAVALALGRREQAGVALHTAGALPASALSALSAHAGKGGGTSIGSFHPLKAFPRPLTDLAEAAGVVFGADGDPAAVAIAERIAAAWGAKVVVVPPESRRLYHFAASLAAGGVVTLLAMACELGGRLGLPAAVSEGYLELARGALDNVEPARPEAAITGPVARGDAAVVAAAFEELRGAAPDLVTAALAVARETLRQVQRNPSSNSAYEELNEALERVS